MTILPGETPCLRCVFEAAPAPGEAGTCETAGVLAPVVSIIASFQATEAIKLLAGKRAAVNRDLIYLDVWENVQRRIKIANLLGKVDCPCCQRRRFEWLEGEHGATVTSLCGRNAVQVSHRSATRLNFEELAGHLRADGAVTFNKFLLKFTAGEEHVSAVPDRPGVPPGTQRRQPARRLYAQDSR